MTDRRPLRCPRRRKARSTSLSKSNSSRGSCSYEKDSSWLNSESIPTCTSNWDIITLESLGIFYDKNYQASPLDILDKIFEKRKIFGQVNEIQKKYIDNVKHNMLFSSSYKEILETKRDQGLTQEILSEKLLPEMKKDIENFRNHTGMSNLKDFMGVHTVAEDFIFNARQVVIYETAYLRDMEYRSEQGPASKDMYVEVVRSFARMCRLAVGFGSSWKGKMLIQDVKVSSRADLVLMPLDFCHEPLGDLALQKSSIVTVVEAKNLKRGMAEHYSGESTPVREPELVQEPSIYQKVKPGALAQHGGEPSIYQKVKPGALAQHGGEPSIYQKVKPGALAQHGGEPSIYQKVKPEALAQHGGDLLLYYRSYQRKLVDNLKDLQYFPGMLVVSGTEVIFTLLEIQNQHLVELKSTDPINKSLRAKIHYSEPKDLLKREDRDVLLEAFIRLNNI